MKRSMPWAAACVVLAGCNVVPRADAPTAPTPAGPPTGWFGAARYDESRVSQFSPGTMRKTFEGTVTWQRDDRPDPTLPAGAVQYAIASGQGHATVHADGSLGDELVDTCVIAGDGPFEFLPFQQDPEDDPAEWRSYLVVYPDSRYKGAIHTAVAVPAAQECPGFFGRFTWRTEVHLYIDGTLGGSGRRMQGAMEPDQGGDTLWTGSWDFEAR